MSTCYMCKDELTEMNRTEEHIFLNSIGGRLKSTKLICKACNSKFGSGSDSELSDQLNFLANILMIKRERGNPPPVLMERESTGQRYFVDHQGKPEIEKPVFEQTTTGSNTQIRIQARAIEEARKMLTGLKKKNPNLDVDAIMSAAKVIREPIDEHLHVKLVIGGNDSLPAILKMSIGYYIELKDDMESVANAIVDLKKNDASRVEPIILENRIFDLDEKEITHSVFLFGDANSKRLYAIVELFSVVQFAVRLSDAYMGEDFQDLYVYDVIERVQRTKFAKNIPSHDFIFRFSYPASSPNFQILQEAMERLMAVATERQHSYFQGEMIGKAWDNTINKLIPPGAPVTSEAADAFTQELMKELEPYIARMLNYQASNI